MVDVFEVAESLMNHIKSRWSNDVAIAAYYGSYAQGTATKRSDLDFFFIPATPEGFKVSIQFIVDDISFDFWPISWERAERMARLEDSQTTIIADCKLLYVRSEEDLERFMRLRETVAAVLASGNDRRLVEVAESRLRDAHIHLHKMTCDPESQLTGLRTEAQGVLTNVLECLALLNGTYFTRGFGKNKEQILQLPLCPSGLETLMNTIMRSNSRMDVLRACETMAYDTVKLVLDKRKCYSNGPSYRDRMKGFYEEEKGILDKIRTACETKDYDTVFFFAIQAQQEIAHFLHFAEYGQWPSQLMSSWNTQGIYRQLTLPDLVGLLDPNDFGPLLAAIEQLSTRLESHLIEQGVEINRFGTIEEFEKFLGARP